MNNDSFIVLATVITIINYDRKMFIVQATGLVFQASNILVCVTFSLPTCKAESGLTGKF